MTIFAKARTVVFVALLMFGQRTGSADRDDGHEPTVGKLVGHDCLSVGCGKPTLRGEHNKAIASGRLRAVGRDAKGSHITDVAAARAEWKASARGPSLADEQRGLTIERRRSLELANRLKTGALHEAKACIREQFEAARTVRDAILNVPDRVAAELAAESDARRVHGLLMAELKRALENIAAILERG